MQMLILACVLDLLLLSQFDKCNAPLNLCG